MRLLLIVNPTASSVTPRAAAAIADALAVSHELAVEETSARDHATDLARDAAGRGVDVVVAFGGDGTLNEATQGLAGTTTALAPLPGGSTNVFARTLGIDYAPLDACAQLLQSLTRDSTRRVGIGVATCANRVRRFVFHLGMGFDAATVRQMEQRHARMKRHLAHPAFAVAAVETWLHHYDRATTITLHATDEDGAVVDRRAQGPYAVVSNSDPYTYVGRRPVTLAPDAGLDRALAVTVFETLHPWLLARAAVSGLARARFVATTPAIAQIADVHSVCVTGDRPFPWQVDGDHLGSTTRIDVRYEPDALTLVVPAARPARRRARR